MLDSYKPYAIVYRVTGRPEVEEQFDSEKEMRHYCNIWLDYPDMDYVNYFAYDIEYTPDWAWV